MRLSATYHPMEFLSKKVNTMYPSLLGVDMLYADKNGNLVFSSNNETTPLATEDKTRLQQLRDTKMQSRWVSKDFIYNPNKWYSGKQVELIEETGNTTLLLFLTSVIDGKSDVLILNFPKQFSFYNQINEIESLETNEKALIADALYRPLKFDYNQIVEEAKILKQFSEIQRAKKSDLELKRLQYTELEKIYFESTEGLIKELINAKNIEYAAVFILEDDFVNSLAQMKLGLSEMKTLVNHAVDMSFNLNFGSDEIFVSKSYLKGYKKEETGHSELKTDRIELLLDRYEASAQNCLIKGLKVNGKNIASHLSPPVSPPAITDAVKKNAFRIQYLINKYPNKWRMIKEGLKPIQNIQVYLGKVG